MNGSSSKLFSSKSDTNKRLSIFKCPNCQRVLGYIDYSKLDTAFWCAVCKTLLFQKIDWRQK